MSKKTTKGQDYSRIIIWAAALVTVVRYAAAFIASDVGEITGWLADVVTIAMGISGLGMGLLDTVGGAYLFDGWRRAMPRNGEKWPFRFKILTGFVFALIITGVFILVPFTVSRVRHESLAVTLGAGNYLLDGWALLVNVAPYLLIGGISVGQQILYVTTAENITTSPGHTSEISGNFPVAKPRWNRVDPKEYELIAKSSTGDLQTRYGLDERTARNWRKRAQDKRND